MQLEEQWQGLVALEVRLMSVPKRRRTTSRLSKTVHQTTSISIRSMEELEAGCMAHGLGTDTHMTDTIFRGRKKCTRMCLN